MKPERGETPVTEAERQLPDTCPLSQAEQTRNLLIFAFNTGLIYLSAPVLYVGSTQSSLCKSIGFASLGANLPGIAYFATTFVPVILAWYIPYVSALKRTLVFCFAATALMIGAVAVGLYCDAPQSPARQPVANLEQGESDDSVVAERGTYKFVLLALVVAQCAVAGVALSTAVAFMWEAVGRGVAESRRGYAMSLAFGVGPFLAFLSSLGSQLLLNGSVEVPWWNSQAGFALTKISIEHLGWHGLQNFAALYSAAFPGTLLAAFLSSRFIIPQPKQEYVRQPFLDTVFGGFSDFLTNRTLRTAAVFTLLVYSGNLIPSNMNLYTQEVLGVAPQVYAGYQSSLRFFMKGVTGLLLGWVLTRTNPRVGMLATASLYFAAVLWAANVQGLWYLFAFGLHGAGELVGAFGPNYILTASPKKNMRRNMAFITMLMAPTAVYGVLFGTIADYYKNTAPAYGFILSFEVCAGFIGAAIVVALLLLPTRPAGVDPEEVSLPLK